MLDCGLWQVKIPEDLELGDERKAEVIDVMKSHSRLIWVYFCPFDATSRRWRRAMRVVRGMKSAPSQRFR